MPDSVLSAVVAELPKHIELTRREEGCLIFEVHRDPDKPNIFRIYEEFVDQTAFEAHQLRVRQSVWGQVATDVERHYDVTDER